MDVSIGLSGLHGDGCGSAQSAPEARMLGERGTHDVGDYYKLDDAWLVHIAVVRALSSPNH